jgi:hypothetical protein
LVSSDVRSKVSRCHLCVALLQKEDSRYQ